MNILHISIHEGVDRRFVGMMNHSVRQGHNVAFLSLPISLAGAGLDSRVRVAMENLAEGSAGVAKPSMSGAFRKIVRESILALPAFLACPMYVFLMKRRDEVRFASLDQLRRTTLSDFSPDIIHVHDLKAVPFALDIKQVFSSAKVVYDAHEFTPFEASNRKLSRYLVSLESSVANRVDAMITVNEGIAERMGALYGVRKPTVLLNSCEPLPNAVPCSPGTFAEHFGLNDLSKARVRVFFQGSVTAERNVDNLVRAFDLLPGDFHLFVLGYGDLMQRYMTQKNPRVHFARAVSQERLLGFTKYATIGIIPYLANECLNNQLCTPNKLFEFMEAEVPICSSQLPEVDRIVSKFGNGVCFQMETPPLIAQAVMKIADMIASGIFTKKKILAAKDAFSYASQMSVLDSLYERVLK